MILIESLKNYFGLLWGSQAEAILLFMRSINWFYQVRNVLFLAVLLGLSALFIINYEKTRESLRSRQVCRNSLKIENRGNLPMAYLFNVVDLDPKLRVNFSCGGYPLVQLKQMNPVQNEPDSEKPVQTDSNTNRPAPLNQSMNQMKGKVDQVKETMGSPTIQKGQKALQMIGTKTGLFAHLLGGIAGLLPGGMKGKVQQVQQGAQTLQKKLNDTSRLPDQTKARIEGIQRQAEAFTGVDHKNKNKVQNLDGVRVTRTIPEPQEGKGDKKKSWKKEKKSKTPAKTEKIPVWYKKSPVIQPGESMNITLEFISSKNHYEKTAYSYDLEIQQIPQYSLYKAASDKAIPPKILSGIVCFPVRTRYEVYRPVLVTIGKALFCGLLLIFFGYILYR